MDEIKSWLEILDAPSEAVHELELLRTDNAALRSVAIEAIGLAESLEKKLEGLQVST